MLEKLSMHRARGEFAGGAAILLCWEWVPSLSSQRQHSPTSWDPLCLTPSKSEALRGNWTMSSPAGPSAPKDVPPPWGWQQCWHQQCTYSTELWTINVPVWVFANWFWVFGWLAWITNPWLWQEWLLKEQRDKINKTTVNYKAALLGDFIKTKGSGKWLCWPQ